MARIEVVKIPKKHGGGLMVRVDKDAALRLINSLVSQALSGSPNVGREEFHAIDGAYFSVSVHEKF